MPTQEITIIRSENFSQKDLLQALTTNEKAYFDTIAPQKRELWLLGRMALKKATLRRLVSYNCTLSLQDIELIPQCGSAPQVSICSESKTPTLSCTLSHTNGIAIAAVEEGVIGVDVERIRTFDDSFAKAFMTDAELSHTMEGDPAGQNMHRTLHWCIKEAYVKAIGVGLRMHPKRLEICVDYRNRSAEIQADGKPVSGHVNWTALDGTYILVGIRL